MKKILVFLILFIVSLSGYCQAPTVTTVFPNTGSGKMNIILSGTNFTNASSVILRSGVDASVPFTVKNPTTILVNLELSGSKYVNGRNGSVFIVTTPDGSNTTSPNFDYTPIGNTCASFTYGDWQPCTGGVQKRDYIASPSTCNTKPPKDSIQRKCETPNVKFLKYYPEHGKVVIRCNTSGTIDFINSQGLVAETFSFQEKSDNIDITGLPADDYTVKAYDKSINISTKFQVVVESRFYDTLVVKGRFGTPPYTYSVNSTSFYSGNLLERYTKGTYTIRCKDSQGKIASLNVSIPNNSMISSNSLTFTRGTGYDPDADSTYIKNSAFMMSEPYFIDQIYGATGTKLQRVSSTSRDRTPPTLGFITPTNNATYNPTNSIPIRIDAFDNIGVSYVDFFVDGNLYYRWGAVTGNSYQISLPLSSYAVGVHVLSATAYDAAGNNATTSLQINVTQAPPPPPYITDITPPTINFSWPHNGDIYQSPDTIHYSITFQDNYQLNYINAYLLTPTGNAIGFISQDISGNNVPIYTATGSFDPQYHNYGYGIYQIVATVFDMNNNRDTVRLLFTIADRINRDTTFPSSFRLKTPAAMDQLGQGSCSACSFSYCLMSSREYYKTNSTYFSFSTNIFSPKYSFDLYKYFSPNTLNPCFGSSALTIKDYHIDSGCARWAYLPYNPYYRACPDTSSPPVRYVPNLARNDAMAHRLLDVAHESPIVGGGGGFLRIRSNDIAALKWALIHRHVGLVGINLDNIFTGAGPTTIWDSHPQRGDAHLITVIGWDDTVAGGCWIFQNSWGQTWANNGVIYCTYDNYSNNFGYYTLFLNDQFDY